MAKSTSSRASTGKNKSKESKLAQRKTRNENRGNGNTSDWESVDAELIRKLIAVSTVQGISISFGYTDKNGAYAVSFYEWDTKERHSEYCSPNEDETQFLVDLVIWLEG